MITTGSKADKKTLVFLVPCIVAIVSFSVFLLALFNGWMGPAQGVGGGFCEASNGLVKQPANTWSNFAFIFAGLAVAYTIKKETFAQNNNAFTRTLFTPIFFSCLAVLLGPGSMAMHATLTPTGGALDMLSMYLICAFMTAYALQRFYNWQAWQFTLVFASVILICEYLGTFYQPIPILHYAGNAAFAFFISFAVVFEMLITYVRKTNIEQKWGFYSLASMVSAFIIWNLWQNDSPLCDPQSLIQGHAMWHILCALAVYFLFRFYVSEQSAANLAAK